MSTSRVPFRIALIVALCVLVACTMTPQVLPVTPRPAITGDAGHGAGRTLAIEVIDARGTEIVGLRDRGVEDSVITPAPEMLRNIQAAVESGFRKRGFTLVSGSMPADIAMKIRMTSLGYEREAGVILPELKTGATFEVTSVMAEKTVTGIYRDAQTKDTVIRPSLAENSKILNQHIDAALAKLILDTRLTTE